MEGRAEGRTAQAGFPVPMSPSSPPSVSPPLNPSLLGDGGAASVRMRARIFHSFDQSRTYERGERGRLRVPFLQLQ